MSTKLPQPVEDFRTQYADVWKAFTELGDHCHKAGPLDENTRRLVKVALSIGAGLVGGTHSAVRNALASGLKSEEIRPRRYWALIPTQPETTGQSSRCEANSGDRAVT